MEVLIGNKEYFKGISQVKFEGAGVEKSAGFQMV